MERGARLVTTSQGLQLVTEAGDDRCYDGEEVAAINIKVEAGTKCDICGKEIGPRQMEPETRSDYQYYMEDLR